MRCSKCDKEVGNLFCAKCRAEIEEHYKNRNPENLIPLLYYDPKDKCYRFGCLCFKCPCNNGTGVCGVKDLETLEMLKQRLHEFDGDNIVHQVCG